MLVCILCMGYLSMMNKIPNEVMLREGEELKIDSGIPLTYERVEAGEQALMALGFSDLRLRLRDWGALLQLPGEQQPDARRRWGEITEALGPLFPEVRLDAAARHSD